MRVLDVENLSVRYGGVSAVEELDLHVDAGEVVALLGPNGAGKTSTLRGIMGMVAETTGTVRFADRAISGRRTDRIARDGLALVPQGRRVFASLSVEENLRLGGYSLRDQRAGAEILETCYDMFPILRERCDHRAGYLSGGEQQMLAFGRAMMARPKAILMDEPSMGLAPIVVEKVMVSARQIADTGIGVLMVEQNAVAALDVADRTIVLGLGRVSWRGSAAEARTDPALTRAFLGDSAVHADL